MKCPQKNKECVFLQKHGCLFEEGCFPVVEQCYTAGSKSQPCTKIETIKFNKESHDMCSAYRDPYIIWSQGCPLRITERVTQKKKINPLKAAKRAKKGEGDE